MTTPNGAARKRPANPAGPRPVPLEPPEETVPGTPGNRWEHLFEPLDTFLARVASEPEPSWLIPDLLPDRGKVFIVAEPSAGKTWLALLGCRAAATEARDVFLVEEEGSGRSLGWRLKALNMGGAVYIAHAKSVLIDDDACRAALVERVKAARKPVIIFDPFTSLHQGNENDTEHANALRRQLTEVAHAHPESLVVVLHHTSKNLERSDMYAGRGSSVFAGWTDVQLNLSHLPTKKEEGMVAFRVLLAKSRDGHRGLKRDLFIDLASGAVESADPGEQAADDIDGAILKELRGAPGGLQPGALVKALKRRRADVYARLRSMVEAGQLEEARGAEGKVYRLATTSPAEDLEEA